MCIVCGLDVDHLPEEVDMTVSSLFRMPLGFFSGCAVCTVWGRGREGVGKEGRGQIEPSHSSELEGGGKAVGLLEIALSVVWVWVGVAGAVGPLAVSEAEGSPGSSSLVSAGNKL